MLKYIIFPLFLLSFVPSANAQDLEERLSREYADFAEKRIQDRRLKHEDVLEFLDSIEGDDAIDINRVGVSIEGRDLYLLSLGKGDVDVFLWSQMHGDESTATMAIFDMLNFFRSESDFPEREAILSNLRVHFLPMLNPDGAEQFTRRNRLGVDINRDALRLQSPESRTLKRVRDSLDADFGFNLHDQSRYYNALHTDKPATISFLAPAYNYEKTINEVRGNAMRIIVMMNRVLQEFVPGQVGRYNDDFEPRAFGDNIQKWGTSTILIESGGQFADREKQQIRKLNFIAILKALQAIATMEYEQVSVEDYFEIPNNDRKLFDLKLEEVSYELLGNTYTLDVGLQQGEKDYPDHDDFYIMGSIADLGDLSTHYGYQSLDAKGLKIEPAAVYPEILEDLKAVMSLDHYGLIRQGYGYLRVKEIPEGINAVNIPMHIIATDHEPDTAIMVGNNPSFFLANSMGSLRYYVVNGYLVNLESPEALDNCCRNGLIYR